MPLDNKSSSSSSSSSTPTSSTLGLPLNLVAVVGAFAPSNLSLIKRATILLMEPTLKETNRGKKRQQKKGMGGGG